MYRLALHNCKIHFLQENKGYYYYFNMDFFLHEALSLIWSQPRLNECYNFIRWDFTKYTIGSKGFNKKNINNIKVKIFFNF